MGQTIEQFGGWCRDILKRGHGRAELDEVKRGLEEMLSDDDIVGAILGPQEDSTRKVIYQDPELDFCILTHVYKGANESGPHDHGPTWAIYGQARGTTEMTEFRIVDAYEGNEPGKVAADKTYELVPGMAVAYEVGQVHAPKRAGETRLIRIEGRDVSTVKRTPYELA
jgi:predicted metal-dependent enzyme (double-stranded beta helix superfamily)